MPSREPPDRDPLDAVLRPPFDETPEEKVMRLAQEVEAHRISAAIDEDIKRERALRKKKQIVKLLLLGQSESGACVPRSIQNPSVLALALRPVLEATPPCRCACLEATLAVDRTAMFQWGRVWVRTVRLKLTLLLST